MCVPSRAERICLLRPRWDKVEAVGALLPQARLPYRSRWSLGWPASTHSIRLQPWTGSLFPQKPADSTVSPLVLVCPAGHKQGDMSARRRYRVRPRLRVWT